MIKLDPPPPPPPPPAPKPKPPPPSSTATSATTRPSGPRPAATPAPASTQAPRPLGLERSPSGSRAIQSRALGSPDAPAAPSTTLLTENTKDSSRNCLDAAGDWLALAPPQIRARSEVLILKDTRPGPEGNTGHVVIRQGETVFDPSSGQTYPNFNAFNAQGNYQIAHTVTGSAMNKILSTPPGSPERQAAINAAKIPDSVQKMLLADNNTPATGSTGSPITIPLGTPTTTLPGDPSGVVRVDVSRLLEPLRSQLQAANAITTNTGAGSGVSFTQPQPSGPLYVAVNSDRQLVDVQNGTASVFRTGTANVLSVFAQTNMSDPAQVRSAYCTALGLTQGQQSLQPLPTNAPLTADQVAAYQSLGYTVAVLDPKTGLAAVRPPGAPGAQDISNIGAVPGGSPVYVLAGGPPLSTFGNLTPQQMADIHNGVAALPENPTPADIGRLVDGQDAFWTGDNQNPAAVTALATFMADRYAPTSDSSLPGPTSLDSAMYALQAATGPFTPQTAAALAAESLNPALTARGARPGDVAMWAMNSATTPQATQMVLDAIGPQNMQRFVGNLQLSGLDPTQPGYMTDPAMYGSGSRQEALTAFLNRASALPSEPGTINGAQTSFVLAAAQSAGPYQLSQPDFREALGKGLGTVTALGDPQKAAAESARLGALFRSDSVGQLLSALPPAQRGAAMVAMMSTPALSADLVAQHGGNVITAMANAQLQGTSQVINAGFGTGDHVPLDQNGMPVIQPGTQVPLPSPQVLQRHPELAALGQSLTAGSLAVAVQQGRVTPQQAAAYLDDLAAEATTITSPDRTNPNRYSPDFLQRVGSNVTSLAIDAFNGGNPMIKSGLTAYGQMDAADLHHLADLVRGSTDPAFIASAVTAGGAEHQAFNAGLPAYGNAIAAMGAQVQGRRELVMAGLGLAVSLAAPMVAIGLVPEGATIAVGATTLSARAVAFAGTTGMVSTFLNATGQYDQTGQVQWGNAVAGGAVDALTAYFGFRVLEVASARGGLTLGQFAQTTAINTAGGLGSYVLGTPGALDGLLHGDQKYIDGAVRATGTALATSVVVSGIMAPAAYPTTEEQLAAREAQIEAQVAQMSPLRGAQQQAMSEIEGLGVSTVDVWQGSHVVVQDGGAMFEEWSKLPGVTDRSGSSSHYPGVNTPQYQIRYGDSALLFGKDANGNTWFQMESHAVEAGLQGAASDTTGTAAHLWDYLVYKTRGQNVGPMGLSPWTESNPLVIQSGG